jgi:hypothetical protein
MKSEQQKQEGMRKEKGGKRLFFLSPVSCLLSPISFRKNA